MKKRLHLGLTLTLALTLLSGCAGAAKQATQGASSSGSLTRETAGRELLFNVQVENQGDPVGTDFRGVLTQGSLSLQMVNSQDEIYQAWDFDALGPFAMNTTLYPPPGEYQLGIAWEGAVQAAQYSLAWQPEPIEAPQVPPLALLSGVGMILVALGYVIYAGVRRLGWGYLGLGALGWGIAVALKFLWAIPINTPVHAALTTALPAPLGGLIFDLYVGALTGVFEVALVWLVLRYTRLGRVSWQRTLAFGIGFGGVEALLLGVGSLASALVAMAAPATLPLGTLQQYALTSNPLYGLAPIWERFFTVLVHIFSNVLLFYGVRKRQARWLWLAFAYKTGIDAIAAWAQFWGLGALGRLWTIEAIVALWGLAGWLGTRAVRASYPPLEEGLEPEEA
jgi:uncharacterized membrane protein YhfC